MGPHFGPVLSRILRPSSTPTKVTIAMLLVAAAAAIAFALRPNPATST